MLYVILIIVLINLVLPIAVSNRTRFLQERVEKKAARMGVEVKFDD